jgi:hypothetical protein
MLGLSAVAETALAEVPSGGGSIPGGGDGGLDRPGGGLVKGPKGKGRGKGPKLTLKELRQHFTEEQEAHDKAAQAAARMREALGLDDDDEEPFVVTETPEEVAARVAQAKVRTENKARADKAALEIGQQAMQARAARMAALANVKAEIEQASAGAAEMSKAMQAVIAQYEALLAAMRAELDDDDLILLTEQ